MTQKYEHLTNDEIINQYKINKQKERERNKIAYEKLKENKIKYRQRLIKAYDYQVERLKKIKEDDEKYKEFKQTHNIINKTCYYNRMLKNADNKIIEFYSDDGTILNLNEFQKIKDLQNNMNNLKLD
jgi:hypothetical protein